MNNNLKVSIIQTESDKALFPLFLDSVTNKKEVILPPLLSSVDS